MELSYGWTSCLAPGLQGQPAQTELRALRARPVLKGQQAPRALQDHRAPRALRGQQERMLIPLNSIRDLRSTLCLPPHLLPSFHTLRQERKCGTIPTT